ncbi:hypothetical protein [Bacillus tequilensis]|uniref:hypothetical protein n=1 Tax=Bacillus tequilensis TaxID=227866 RepID=UPI0020C68AD7|nr:hypothetical protein [Bacillus tequilensis]
MYWTLGGLLYLLIGTCIFIRVSRNSQSSSRLLLILAAPFVIFGYPYFFLKQLLAKR